MIRFEGVSKIYRGGEGRETVAVDDLDLAVGEGEVLCLIGRSGSGKSTVLRMVNGLIVPTAGVVTVDGASVPSRDPIALRRSIGYVIQRVGLFPHLTIERNVGLLGELEGWPAERTRSRVGELLELVGLPCGDFAHRHPSELSGGQQQRVGIARALFLDPPVLLMDEPFGAVDPVTRRELHAEFRRLQSNVAKTVLLVTHDLAEAFALGDRVALLEDGRLLQAGTEDDFLRRPVSGAVAEFVAGAATGEGTDA